MEQRLRSVVPVSLLVIAFCIAFALQGRAALTANHFLAWIRDFCLVAAGAMWIAYGLRDLRRRGIGLKTIAIPVYGVLVLAVVGALTFSALRFYESAADLLVPPDLLRLTENADSVISDPDSPPERRALASRLKARHVFLQTGQVLTVIDEAGNTKRFIPTEQDRQQKREDEQLRVLIPLGERNARWFLHALGFVALSALALGLATPVQRAPAA